ncbi:MAG: hypothetical protein WCX96_03030 [Bacilli bacterium]
MKEKINIGRNALIVSILLIVIIIFVFIWGPKIINNLTKKEILIDQETELKSAAIKLFASNPEALPQKIGEKRQISLKTLRYYKYSDNIFDSNNKVCDENLSHVEVKKVTEGNYEYYPFLVCENYTTTSTWSDWSNWSEEKPITVGDNTKVEEMLRYNYVKNLTVYGDFSDWQDLVLKVNETKESKEEKGYEYQYQTIYSMQAIKWLWANNGGRNYALGYYESAPTGYPYKDSNLSKKQYYYTKDIFEYAGGGSGKYYVEGTQPSQFKTKGASKNEYKFTRKNGKNYATGGEKGYYTEADGKKLISQGYIKDESTKLVKYQYYKTNNKRINGQQATASGDGYWLLSDANALAEVKSGKYFIDKNSTNYTFWYSDNGVTTCNFGSATNGEIQVRYKKKSKTYCDCWKYGATSNYIWKDYKSFTSPQYNFVGSISAESQYIMDSSNRWKTQISNTNGTQSGYLYRAKTYYTKGSCTSTPFYDKDGSTYGSCTEAFGCTCVGQGYKYGDLLNTTTAAIDSLKSKITNKTFFSDSDITIDTFVKYKYIIKQYKKGTYVNRSLKGTCGSGQKEFFCSTVAGSDWQSCVAGISGTSDYSYERRNRVYNVYQKQYKYAGDGAYYSAKPSGSWTRGKSKTYYKYYKVGTENTDWVDKKPDGDGWTTTTSRTLYKYYNKSSTNSGWVDKQPSGNGWVLKNKKTLYKYYNESSKGETKEYYATAPIGYPIKIESSKKIVWSDWSTTIPNSNVEPNSYKQKLQVRRRIVSSQISAPILEEYVTQIELEKLLGKTLEEIKNDPSIDYVTKVLYKTQERDN